jgi:hypothetical protein
MEAGQGTIAGFEFGRRVLPRKRWLLADGAPIVKTALLRRARPTNPSSDKPKGSPSKRKGAP